MCRVSTGSTRSARKAGTTQAPGATAASSNDTPTKVDGSVGRVQWGEESFDEMGNVRFQVVTVNKEDEAVLQQAMAGALKAALSSAVQNGALKKLMEAREKKRKAGGS